MSKQILAAVAATLFLPAFTAAQTSVTTNKFAEPRQSQHDEGKMMRASEIVGLSVTNGHDETVGEIHDLVLDDATGRVKYVALSVGGFLGIGDKLFAIPQDAFHCNQNADGDVVVTLNAKKEDFEDAEGFDQNNWPNMADRNWRDRNRASYSDIDRHADADRYEKTERQRLQEEAARQRSNRGFHRVSELIGLNVHNRQDETIGEIHDLMLGSRRGKVAYVAFEAGGTWGFGDSLFAVPFDAFDLRKNDNHDTVAMLDARKELFENAEGFDQDNWPDTANRQWRDLNDRGYSSLKRYERYDDEARSQR